MAATRDALTLLEYAQAKPLGFDYDELEQELGWHYQRFMRAVRRLRVTLLQDELNLPCEPNGARQRWTYRLVGNPDDSTVRAWQSNRLEDTETRLDTIYSVAVSVARNADRRTLIGRKAHMIESTVGYLRDQLALVNDSK